VASSELAFATGRGPKQLTSFEGYNQLVKDEDVVVFGFRDSAEQIKFGSQPLPSSITAIDLNEIREIGIAKATEEALKRLCRSELDGFWLHLDADVLSDSIMPAVDYRQPGGLSWGEFVKMLRLICTSNSAVGLNVTIYNPLLDPRNRIGPRFVEAIVKGLNPHVG
jgi:arginase